MEMKMSREPEYLVVAVKPSSREKRQQVMMRHFRSENDYPGEEFERAKKCQSRLKFEEGYQGVFIYECYRMDLVDGEFVSTVPYQDDPYPITDSDIVRVHVVAELRKRGYSEEQIARLEEQGYLDVEFE
jgi:RimJ/RimL family protein N-acetyltransferase